MLPTGCTAGKYPATEMYTNLSNDVLQRVSRDTLDPVSSSGMMPDSQTQLEAAEPRVSFADPKSVVNIGFWNVRTMF